MRVQDIHQTLRTYFVIPCVFTVHIVPYVRYTFPVMSVTQALGNTKLNYTNLIVITLKKTSVTKLGMTYYSINTRAPFRAFCRNM